MLTTWWRATSVAVCLLVGASLWAQELTWEPRVEQSLWFGSWSVDRVDGRFVSGDGLESSAGLSERRFLGGSYLLGTAIGRTDGDTRQSMLVLFGNVAPATTVVERQSGSEVEIAYGRLNHPVGAVVAVEYLYGLRKAVTWSAAAGVAVDLNGPLGLNRTSIRSGEALQRENGAALLPWPVVRGGMDVRLASWRIGELRLVARGSVGVLGLRLPSGAWLPRLQVEPTLGLTFRRQ